MVCICEEQALYFEKAGRATGLEQKTEESVNVPDRWALTKSFLPLISHGHPGEEWRALFLETCFIPLK